LNVTTINLKCHKGFLLPAFIK